MSSNYRLTSTTLDNLVHRTYISTYETSCFEWVKDNTNIKKLKRDWLKEKLSLKWNLNMNILWPKEIIKKQKHNFLVSVLFYFIHYL